jgi:hypothetical protein
MFSNIDGGRSWIFSFVTFLGSRRRRFLTLMVDPPGSSGPTPPRGTVVDVF